MTIRILGLLIALASSSLGQDAGAMEQRIAALGEAVAASKQALKLYTWVENTDVFVKGEIRKHDQAQCRYGADGQLQKTPISAPHQPAKKKKQGKKAQKKAVAFEQYADRFRSLISRYAPPNMERIREAQRMGNVSLQSLPGGNVAFVVKRYLKAGDEMAVTFDPAGRTIVRYNVFTYLDGAKDQVNLAVEFDDLPDGNGYVSEIEMSSGALQMLVKTSNYDHKKLQ
jgi:hypothetical protein